MERRRFGPYELEELLGRGGMGEVHRAIDTRKNRTVALKLLPAEFTGDTDVEARFRREAEVAARLNDPHVIPIHDYGELHGRLFLDMRFVAGTDLARVIRRDGAIPPERAVDVVGQVADALDAAHDDGLVHRDVKPSNVLLAGDRGFVYLIDFGIAVGAMSGTRLTATGQAIGTAAYMAPERFTDTRDADRRVDVYALGCVLHELLTGAVPYAGTTFPSLMYQHLKDPPPRPSTAGALPAFDAVVATALAKDPARRYQRAGDLAAAAREALASGGRRSTVPPGWPTARPAPETYRPAVPMETYRPMPPTPPAPAPAPTRQDAPAGLTPGAPVTDVRTPVPRWRLVSAVLAVIVLAIWSFCSIAGTAATFSNCGRRSASCVGGVVGLGAVAACLVGLVSGVLVMRSLGGRLGRVGTAWALFGAAFVLLVVTAFLDGA